MKVMSLYLPQYHAFKENDEWWGKGYTEWTAVKRAVPLFKGHREPRVPLGERYYDLEKDGVETLKWQAELARKYGVYGFSIYQYWFKGRQLMYKPMEILLEHPEIDINYNICWANETWTRTWYGLKDQVLMEQTYGDEKDWKYHFDYLLRFFKDPRYIKENNRPMLMIYRSFDIECMKEMKGCFNKWAVEAGFEGVYFVIGKTAAKQEEREGIADAYYYFEPGYTLKHDFSKLHEFEYNASVFIKSCINKVFHRKILERKIPAEHILYPIAKRDYKRNEYPGIIGDWDNTPRRDYKGLVYSGTSPKLFEETLNKLKGKIDNDAYVFVNAWNEWGEGAMLEPDEFRGYEYLEAIKRVIS